MDDSKLKLLENFVLDVADLAHLESLVNPFNIFEAIGVVSQELRHSDFLAYLLSPKQNHGLEDAFPRRLLQKAISTANKTSTEINVVDLDTWDMDRLKVIREWKSIDILLRDEPNRFVAAIENKIASKEHSDQLGRYWQALSIEFPGWKKIGLYLTPDGEPPSCPEYLPIDYGSVADVLETLSSMRVAASSPDVTTLISHYIQMLRRHIVAESDIAELCRKIYWKHKKALDLIFEHRPDQQEAVREILLEIIGGDKRLALDNSNKTLIRFAVRDWDDFNLRAEKGWSREGRLLLFEFQNEPNSLRLKLILGPGPREIRQSLLEMALTHKPFKPPSKTLMNQSNELYGFTFLPVVSLEDVDESQFVATTRNAIEHRWQEFVNNGFPEIAEVISNQVWLKKQTPE